MFQGFEFRKTNLAGRFTFLALSLLREETASRSTNSKGRCELTSHDVPCLLTRGCDVVRPAVSNRVPLLSRSTPSLSLTTGAWVHCVRSQWRPVLAMSDENEDANKRVRASKQTKTQTQGRAPLDDHPARLDYRAMKAVSVRFEPFEIPLRRPGSGISKSLVRFCHSPPGLSEDASGAGSSAGRGAKVIERSKSGWVNEGSEPKSNRGCVFVWCVVCPCVRPKDG